jgi:twinkle protein
MNAEGQTSELIAHQPCPCGKSSDAYALYTDGHAYCFSCSRYDAEAGGDGVAASSSKRAMSAPKELIALPQDYAPITSRLLTEETTRRWGYFMTNFNGQPVQVATYRDDEGFPVAQKIRFKNKDFTVLGNLKAAQLFGQNLCRGDGGKRVIVTEGEIDAMSVAQALNHRWDVVSVPNGSAGAAKALSKQMSWLLKFEQVVLCFDMDEPGRAATDECARLFPPGRVAVVHLPLKDPSDMLKEGRIGELVQALWGATTYRPDGLVTLADIKEKALVPPSWGLPYFLPSLTKTTYGRRYGEAVALGAGTGVGKTDWLTQQISYDLCELSLPVAAFFLEQQPVETVQRIAGKTVGKLFHIPDTVVAVDELKAAIDAVEAKAPLYLYDSFGATDWPVIRDRIRFLAHAHGVRIFYLDHLTALVAGVDEERVELERIMADIGGLVKELDIWLCFVSHLTTPDGKPHEEGGRVTIRHFKGSRAIGFWSHFMFGLERNQQSDEEDERSTSTFRVLKDRFTGRATGQTIPLLYDRDTGIIAEGESSSGFGAVPEENKDF